MARRYELTLEEALAKVMPRYLISEADYVQEMASAQGLIKRHEAKLAECCRTALGNKTPILNVPEDWILAQDAVKEVIKLRFNYDNLLRAYEDVKREFTKLRERVEKLDAEVVIDD